MSSSRGTERREGPFTLAPGSGALAAMAEAGQISDPALSKAIESASQPRATPEQEVADDEGEEEVVFLKDVPDIEIPHLDEALPVDIAKAFLERTSMERYATDQDATDRDRRFDLFVQHMNDQVRAAFDTSGGNQVTAQRQVFALLVGLRDEAMLLRQHAGETVEKNRRVALEQLQELWTTVRSRVEAPAAAREGDGATLAEQTRINQVLQHQVSEMEKEQLAASQKLAAADREIANLKMYEEAEAKTMDDLLAERRISQEWRSKYEQERDQVVTTSRKLREALEQLNEGEARRAELEDQVESLEEDVSILRSEKEEEMAWGQRCRDEANKLREVANMQGANARRAEKEKRDLEELLQEFQRTAAMADLEEQERYGFELMDDEPENRPGVEWIHPVVTNPSRQEELTGERERKGDLATELDRATSGGDSNIPDPLLPSLIGIETEMASLRERLHNCLTHRAALDVELQEKDDEMGDLRNRLENCLAQRTALNDELIKKSHVIKRLKKLLTIDVEARRAQGDRVRQRHEELDRLLATAEREVSDAHKQQLDADNKAHDRERFLRSQVSQLKVERDGAQLRAAGAEELVQELRAVQAAASSADDRIAQLQKLLTKYQLELEQSREALARANRGAERAIREKEHECERQKDGLKQQVTQLRERTQQVEGRERNLERRNGFLERENVRLQAGNRELEERLVQEAAAQDDEPELAETTTAPSEPKLPQDPEPRPQELPPPVDVEQEPIQDTEALQHSDCGVGSNRAASQRSCNADVCFCSLLGRLLAWTGRQDCEVYRCSSGQDQQTAPATNPARAPLNQAGRDTARGPDGRVDHRDNSVSNSNCRMLANHPSLRCHISHHSHGHGGCNPLFSFPRWLCQVLTALVWVSLLLLMEPYTPGGMLLWILSFFGVRLAGCRIQRRDAATAPRRLFSLIHFPAAAELVSAALAWAMVVTYYHYMAVRHERNIWLGANLSRREYLLDVRDGPSPYLAWSPLQVDIRLVLEPVLAWIADAWHEPALWQPRGRGL